MQQDPPPMTIRRAVWIILEVAHSGERFSAASKAADIAIIFMIIASVLFTLAGMMPETEAQNPGLFWTVAVISGWFFSIEYLARLWSATASTRYKTRANFAKNPLAVIDLAAVAPFWLSALPWFETEDLSYLRLLRLAMLIARIFKLGRYSRSFQKLIDVVRKTKDELVALLVLLGSWVVVSACVVFYFEAQVPEPAFKNIADGLWWSIVTVTSTGYGDYYPVTSGGRFFASITMIGGLVIVSLFIGIITAGYSLSVEVKNCPHCGEPLAKMPK